MGIGGLFLQSNNYSNSTKGKEIQVFTTCGDKQREKNTETVLRCSLLMSQGPTSHVNQSLAAVDTPPFPRLCVMSCHHEGEAGVGDGKRPGLTSEPQCACVCVSSCRRRPLD